MDGAPGTIAWTALIAASLAGAIVAALVSLASVRRRDDAVQVLHIDQHSRLMHAMAPVKGR